MSADPAKQKSIPILLMIGFLVIALIMYMVILGWRGVQLIASGTVSGIGIGIGVLILPVLGAWMIYSTLSAGIWHQRLAAAATAQDRDVDVSDLDRRPSGRLERAAADDLFDRIRAEWELNPDDWCNSYRIARAYDYAGDRGRARQMMKTAVAQYRAEMGDQAGR